jgi:Kef-type K+ transport system membrane component KefB
MAIKIIFILFVGVAIIAGAIVCYSAIGELPLRNDLLGQIIVGCLRAADIAIAGAIVILLVRRAYR